MNEFDGLATLTPAKRLITEGIRNALITVPGIISITFVGSFVDREDLSGISDIDTIVVFDRLTPVRFTDAVAAVSALTGCLLGLPRFELHVNATLGPLKYDGPRRVVVHLMLYDLASHRQHVLRSPFTCLDWERSRIGWGVQLMKLYPVGRLQPLDFIAARRGLVNYVTDLESGRLSFRRFEPRGDVMVEVPDSIALDRRHQGEYAYHIVHNLVANYLKMLTGQNRLVDDSNLRGGWVEQLPALAGWLPFYETIRAVKIARSDAFPIDTISTTRDFLSAFSALLDRVIAGMTKLRLVRHGRTLLNDGTFLGRGRDPELAEAGSIRPEVDEFDAVYSSPLRRAVQTARALIPCASIQTDARLIEIEYGQAEGLTIDGLQKHFPHVVEAWAQGEDSPFPGGEGTNDVVQRARSFLTSAAQSTGSILAVTHNVVLRVIVADIMGLDVRQAFRIPIEHLQPLDVCYIGGRWLPNWGGATKARLLDGFVGWQHVD